MLEEVWGAREGTGGGRCAPPKPGLGGGTGRASPGARASARGGAPRPARGRRFRGPRRPIAAPLAGGTDGWSASCGWHCLPKREAPLRPRPSQAAGAMLVGSSAESLILITVSAKFLSSNPLSRKENRPKRIKLTMTPIKYKYSKLPVSKSFGVYSTIARLIEVIRESDALCMNR